MLNYKIHIRKPDTLDELKDLFLFAASLEDYNAFDIWTCVQDNFLVIMCLVNVNENDEYHKDFEQYINTIDVIILKEYDSYDDL